MTITTEEHADVQQFLSGKLTQIDVPSLLKELNSLWKSAMDAPEDGQKGTVARTCTLNLILYTSEVDAEVSVSGLLDAITVRHPCRALLAIARPSENLSLEAWVSARCHLSPGKKGKQICCEQITVRWEGDGLYELPSVVLPLLLTELPTFLWWRTDDFEVKAIEPFLPATDRLVVDSGRWGANIRWFEQLDALRIDNRSLKVSDLSWRALLPWRQVLASSFDGLGGFTPSDLQSIEKVEVKYASNKAQALLLVSWLASRLGWTPAGVRENDAGHVAATFKYDGRTIEAVASNNASPDMVPESPGLTQVKLDLAGGKSLTATAESRDSLPAFVAVASGSEREFLVQGKDLSEQALVTAELDVLERDPVFEQSLAMASQLLIQR